MYLGFPGTKSRTQLNKSNNKPVWDTCLDWNLSKGWSLCKYFHGHLWSKETVSVSLKDTNDLFWEIFFFLKGIQWRHLKNTRAVWIFFFLSKFRKWSASCFQSTQSQLKSEPSAVGASCSSRCLSKPPLLAGWGAEEASVQPGGAGEACGMALRSSTGQCSHLGLLFFFF